MFQVLCAELRPCIFKNDTRFRNAVLVDKQIVATFIICQMKAVLGKLPMHSGLGKALSQLLLGELQKQYLFIWHQNIYKYLARKKKFKRW